MGEKLVGQIRLEFEMYETEYLLEIWENEDREEWTAEAFEAIQQILVGRLGRMPEKTPIHKARLLIRQSEELQADGDINGALDLCAQAIRLSPDLAQAHNLCGLLYDAQGDSARAVASYREAVRSDPDFGEAMENLNLQLEKWIAQNEGRNIEEIYPYLPHFPQATHTPVPKVVLQHARELILEASVLEEADNFEEAIVLCENALRLAPNFAEAHNLRGVLYDRAGDSGLAINEYHEAVRLDPRFHGASANLSEALAEWYEEYGQEGDGEVDLAALYDALSQEEKEALVKDPRWGGDIPGAFYLDEPGLLLRGWSGNRTQPGSSGLDPLSSEFETAQILGRLIRQLYTGQFRTRNPIYQLLMFLVGGLLSLPLVIGLLVLAAGQWYDSWILVVLCTFAVPGLALLWNAYMSTIDLT